MDVAPGARLLDVACGGGRHLRHALSRGLTVTGVDRDLSRVADLLGRPEVSLIAVDLEAGAPFPLAGCPFDVVVVTNYLHRPLFPALLAAVAPGGLLVHETFQTGQEAFGRPRDPRFLLAPGELALTVGGELDILAYEEVQEGWPPRALRQRIAARRLP